MKKILLPLLMLLFSYGTKAQNSSMTIENHATCSVEVTLYASFDYMGYPNCGLWVQFVMPPGGLFNQPSYWDLHAAFPFMPIGPAPIPKVPPFGTAPAWIAPDGFHWEYASFAGLNPHGSQTPGPGICFPTVHCAGNPCGGFTCPPPHTWVNTGGDIRLDIY